MDPYHRLNHIEALQTDTLRAVYQATSILLEIKQQTTDNNQRLKAGAVVLKELKNQKQTEPLSKKKLTLAAVMFLTGLLLITNDIKDLTAFLTALGGVLKAF